MNSPNYSSRLFTLSMGDITAFLVKCVISVKYLLQFVIVGFVIVYSLLND